MQIWLVVFLWALSALSASAQTNEVLTHYRTYAAALEQGDYATAESAASAALAASEARDGDGGRTAVLALNLATVRLLQDRRSEAAAPARRALNLALARGPASGVDPTMAALLVGRAELGANLGVAERLAATLVEAEPRTELERETYLAAVALGRWSFSQRLYAMAKNAWAVAVRTSSGAQFDTPLARADALTWEAASLIMATTTRPRRRLSSENGRLALAGLLQAEDLLHERASRHAEDESVTRYQVAYAYARAWTTMAATLLDDGYQPIADALSPERLSRNRAMSVAGPPICAMRVADFDFQYPEEALDDYQIGVVIARVKLNEAGDVMSGDAIATVGRVEFERAVQEMIAGVQIERAEDAAPGCIMPTYLYLPIRFDIR